MKGLFAATAILLASASTALANSTLDWYAPKVTTGKFYCVNDDQSYLECQKWGAARAQEIADKIMDHCKSASCDGSFTSYELDVAVSAVFPPGAKGEFNTQVHNIMHKMLKTDGVRIGSGPANMASLTYPHKMIINRTANDNEKGHLEITITHSGDGDLCAVMKDIAAAGGVIPEVGPFFGLINIANC